MRRTSFRQWPCSIARSMDLLGDWWTPLVLREVFFGSTRFDDIQRGLSIGRNVLAARLRRLTSEGLLERRQYAERPPRYEYHLTEQGQDFFPVLMAMVRWGDRWLHGRSAPPMRLRHTRCGHLTHAELVCAHCREPLAHDEVRSELPSGAAPTLELRAAAVQRVRRKTASSVVAPADSAYGSPHNRRRTGRQAGESLQRRPMGDKSPKSVHKQALQKQTKQNAAGQKKRQEIADKQQLGFKKK